MTSSYESSKEQRTITIYNRPKIAYKGTKGPVRQTSAKRTFRKIPPKRASGRSKISFPQNFLLFQVCSKS